MFGRKQRLLRFSTMHFSVYGSIYPRLNLASTQTGLCLAVILMYLFSFWDGLYWLIISIVDTRLCLTSSTVFQSGKCIIISGLIVDVRWGKPVRLDLSARDGFGQENGASELRRNPHYTLQKHPEEISKSCKVGFASIYISSNSLAKT